MSLNFIDYALTPDTTPLPPSVGAQVGTALGQGLNGFLQGQDYAQSARQKAAELAATLKKSQQSDTVFGQSQAERTLRANDESIKQSWDAGNGDQAIAFANQQPSLYDLAYGTKRAASFKPIVGGVKQVPDGPPVDNASYRDNSDGVGVAGIFGGDGEASDPQPMKTVPNAFNPQTRSAIESLMLPTPSKVLTQGESIGHDGLGGFKIDATAPTPGADMAHALGEQKLALDTQKLEALKDKINAGIDTAQDRAEISRLRAEVAGKGHVHLQAQYDKDGNPLPAIEWNDVTGDSWTAQGITGKPAHVMTKKPFTLQERQTAESIWMRENGKDPTMPLRTADRVQMKADIDRQESAVNQSRGIDGQRSPLQRMREQSGLSTDESTSPVYGGEPMDPGLTSHENPVPTDTPAPTTGGTAHWSSMVDDASQKTGVPVGILHAVMKQESGGNPHSISPAGAIGLMQLMPDTARWLGVDPHDSAQNIEGGAKYLRAMYNKFGNWESAIAAYNAGPGALAPSKQNAKYQIWQAPYNKGYAETRDYVAAIKADLARQAGRR